MKSSTLRVIATATVVALFLAGCSPLQQTLAWVGAGVAVFVVSVAAAKIIARHQATVEQRKIAEERAMLYYAALDAKQKEALKKKKKVLAVDTPQPGLREGEKAVMPWSTVTEQIVGNTVYVVPQPRAGTKAKYDTTTAEYVGSES